MRPTIELETNQGPTTLLLENILYLEKPINMSGFGGAGVGKFSIKVHMLGDHEYLVANDDYDRIDTALDEAGITCIELPEATKKTIVVLRNVSGFHRYEDTMKSRARVKGQNPPLPRGVEVKLADGHVVKAEPRSADHDLYLVFKGVMNDGSED